MKSGNIPESILLIKPSSLGDVIHALPVADALKSNYPSARLAWVVNEEWQEILNGNPCVDEVIAFPRRRFRGVAGIFGGLGWIGGLRHLRPALGIDLQGLLRSAFIARGAGCKRIVGLPDAREGAGLFYHETAKAEKNAHAVDRYLSVLEVLGLEVPASPRFTLPEGTRPEGFRPDAPYLVLHPFSRGEGKSLGRDVVLELCKQWTRTPIVIVGRVADKAAGLEGFPPHVINLLNKTSLTELIWVIRNAGCVVSVDSGPMHLAAAVTWKLLAIHTWSDPRLVGPYFEECGVWKNGRIYSVKDFRKEGGNISKQFTISDLSIVLEWISSHFSGLQ